jgi:hypothetical protein
MSTHETDPHADAAPLEPTRVTPDVPAITHGTNAATWTWTLVAALLAGTAAWLIGEAGLDYYQPSEKAAAEPYDHEPLNREMEVVSGRNGAIAFGALGGLLGLALGLAGGLSRSAVGPALTGAAVGLVLGVAAGGLPAFVVMPWQWRHRNDDPASIDLMVPLATHLALWSGLGLAAGLAFGIGRGGSKLGALLRGAIGGLIGAVVGTALYEMIGAFGFPMDRTTSPIADTATTRLLARLCVALGTAVGVVLAVVPRPAPRRSAS